MNKLSDKLLELCNKQVDTGKSFTMDRFCRNLPRLISSRLVLTLNNFLNVFSFVHSKFSSIMVPLQSSMTATLPGSYCESDSYQHDPFPGHQPTIVLFDDKVNLQLRSFIIILFNSRWTKVEVLPSLQRPKKITVVASDGKSYILLCKPKVKLQSIIEPHFGQ